MNSWGAEVHHKHCWSMVTWTWSTVAAASFAIHVNCWYQYSGSGFQSGLVLILQTSKCHSAPVMRDLAGADTVVCAWVTASTATTEGHRKIQLWVDILRTAWKMNSLVHQGERHTATLDQESPSKPSFQIGVLEWGRQLFEAVLWLKLWQCVNFFHELGNVSEETVIERVMPFHLHISFTLFSLWSKYWSEMLYQNIYLQYLYHHLPVLMVPKPQGCCIKYSYNVHHLFKITLF